ncbi:MAG: glycosyltransferase [Candidatus Peribacteraceae bacterium]|nr:glycosyltransferase [Candidatus Peribacteraceae bacterium]
MKVALVHELLTMRGGAERVLKILADMFPDAPIYTLLFDKRKLGDWFPRERIRTSTLQKTAECWSLIAGHRAFNHHLYLSRFPRAVEAWGFFDYDLVISSSSAFAHGIITNGKPKHLCYVHSPARYLWDRTHDVLEKADQGLLGGLKRRHLERVFHDLRLWDTEVADRPDALLAASKEIQRRIALYWRRDSDVIYPPIDDFWLENTFDPRATEHPHYTLVVSTLAAYKRIELAIEACRRTNTSLKIVGEGPDMARLKRLAHPLVEFCGYRTQEELRGIFANASVTIVPGEEDFNLVALESMACGTPVLSYRNGGPLETIVEGKTGAFFDEPTADSLSVALRSFKRGDFDSDACRARAKEFSRERFEKQIGEAIASLMQ